MGGSGVMATIYNAVWLTYQPSGAGICNFQNFMLVFYNRPVIVVIATDQECLCIFLIVLM
jgi:hypothetical protein